MTTRALSILLFSFCGWIQLSACSSNTTTEVVYVVGDTESNTETTLDTHTNADTGSDSNSDTGSDSNSDCPPPIANETGYLWFSGYEQTPWDEQWGLEWSNLDNHDVTTEGVLFGSKASRVTYPQGISSAEGGAQYKMAFEQLLSPISIRDELYTRYYVKFDEDVDFVLGGKLPGLLGGAGNTGGTPSTGFDGWSARIMWRANGRIVQYVYHADQPGEYGEDMDWTAGGASSYFIPGRWHCVETYIKMNTVGGEGEADALRDGVVRSWLDGELTLDRTDVRFRYTNDFAIDGFYFSTFFGGSGEEWAPIKNEHAMFDNFVLNNTRIGCQNSCIIPQTPLPGPEAINVTSSTRVFDGETTAWSASDWNNNGEIDFASEQNHTDGGSTSAYIRFDPAAWDAAIFSGPEPFNPGEYTHIQMWIRPDGANVRFRVQLRGSTTTDSTDVTVDGSPTFHTGPWKSKTWQKVTIPIEAFASQESQEQLLIRSDTNTPTDGFWIDDIHLVVANPS